MNRLDILKEVYGECEWSEASLISLLRVMELTREDEKIKQMKNIEEYTEFLIEDIVNTLMIQHEAAEGNHNYWLVAANLIKSKFSDTTGEGNE